MLNTSYFITNAQCANVCHFQRVLSDDVLGALVVCLILVMIFFCWFWFQMRFGKID